MPGRYLKEEICTSPDIEALSWQEEVLFYRLLVKCDDFGRYEADPAIIRAACFPRRIAKVRESNVSDWLDNLETTGLIRRWWVGSRRYLEMTGWDRHQRRRAAASRFPEPPSEALFPTDVGRSPADVGRSPADAGHSRTSAHALDPRPRPRPRPSPSPSLGAETPSANGASKRPRDEIFEAVVEVCGYDPAHLTDDARGRVNRATRQLREVGAEPPMIRGFAIQYRDHWPNVDLTPQAIASHWPAFMNGGLEEPARRSRR